MMVIWQLVYCSFLVNLFSAHLLYTQVSEVSQTDFKEESETELEHLKAEILQIRQVRQTLETGM